MQASPTEPIANVELEAATDDAIAACDGDARAAVAALIVTLAAYDAEIADIRSELTAIRASVSRGYIRGRGIGNKADSDVAR